MKKYFVQLAIYSDWREQVHREHISPRNKKYCEMHGLKYVEITRKDFQPQIYFPELGAGDNFHFNRWHIFKKLLDSGKLQDGDLVYQFDADIFIAQMDKIHIPTKSFTYAIDSGNTHCFGFFILRIDEWTRNLVDLLISKERFYKCKDFKLWNEHFNDYRTFYHGDQQAYYVNAGIKPHSWQSFYELPNNGLHSQVTEHTIFSLDELLEHVEILPTDWNVTHLVEETGDNGKPCLYDIVRANPDNIIYRHFAGGQPWLLEKYNNKYPLS